jgi:putative oxidoreductase
MTGREIAYIIISQHKFLQEAEMKNWVSRYQGQVYALLRMVSGAMFAFHGLQKLFGVLRSFPAPEVGSLPWFAGIIELVCGALILVGFQARWAAFLASGEMAVAYIQFHWKLQFGAAFFPAVNGGELALLYSFLFLFFFVHGDGPWSLARRKSG